MNEWSNESLRYSRIFWSILTLENNVCTYGHCDKKNFPWVSPSKSVAPLPFSFRIVFDFFFVLRKCKKTQIVYLFRNDRIEMWTGNRKSRVFPNSQTNARCSFKQLKCTSLRLILCITRSIVPFLFLTIRYNFFFLSSFLSITYRILYTQPKENLWRFNWFDGTHARWIAIAFIRTWTEL